MLDHTENTARLQCLEKGLEHGFCIIALEPVVDIAKGQDAVSTRRWRGRPLIGSPQLSDQGLSINFRLSSKTRSQLIHQINPPLRRTVGIGHKASYHVAALVAQQRREDVGIPATARPDFHHIHLGLHIKESQGLRRMTVNIARHVLGIAVRTGHGVLNGRGRVCRRKDAGKGKAQTDSEIFQIGHGGGSMLLHMDLLEHRSTAWFQTPGQR